MRSWPARLTSCSVSARDDPHRLSAGLHRVYRHPGVKVIARHRDSFDVIALAAGGSRPDVVIEQALASARAWSPWLRTTVWIPFATPCLGLKYLPGPTPLLRPRGSGPTSCSTG